MLSIIRFLIQLGINLEPRVLNLPPDSHAFGRGGGAELRVGGLEIKIQHFVCFSGKLHNKCFKA